MDREGVMGEPMVRHLLEAGHKLQVFTRSPVKTDALGSLALAEELYSRLVTRGFGKEGTQALVRIYRSTS